MQNMTNFFRDIIDAFITISQPDSTPMTQAHVDQFSRIYRYYGNGGLLLALVLCSDADRNLWELMITTKMPKEVIETLTPAITSMRKTLRVYEPFIMQSPPTFTPYQDAVISDCIETFKAWLPVKIGTTYTYAYKG